MAVKEKKAVAAKKAGSKARAVATRKVAAKKPVATKKKAVAKKSRSRSVTSRGDLYMCQECGLVVTVDEMCDCVDVCDIICCGEPMTFKKARAS